MRKFLIAVFLCSLMSSCLTSSELYSWKNYEKTSYAYTKEPTKKNEDELIKTYTAMIENPTGARKVVAPGICAELGYLYFKQGNKQNAMAYFQKEIELYPESAKFINKIIDSINQ